MHLLLGLPLNALLPRLLKTADSSANAEAPMTTMVPTAPIAPMASGAEPLMSPAQHRGTAVLLATLFAMLGFVSAAMAAHLPALLKAARASLAIALLAGSLMGPAQVAALHQPRPAPATSPVVPSSKT